MTEKVFDIVFRGDIVIGQPIDQVKSRLGQMFKLGPDQVDKLFLGSSVVLKRGLSEENAAKYKVAFQKAGAVVAVVPSKLAANGGAGAEAEPKGRRLSLAPLGSSLLPRGNQAKGAAVAMPEVGHISLRPQDGDLVDAAERPQVPAAEVNPVSWDIADPGVDLEELADEVIPLAIPDSNWQVADVGADMEQLKAPEPQPVSAPTLDIAPAGATLVEPKPSPPLAEPDTSYLKVVEDN